jgi:hypothetical protein
MIFSAERACTDLVVPITRNDSTAGCRTNCHLRAETKNGTFRPESAALALSISRGRLAREAAGQTFPLAGLV